MSDDAVRTAVFRDAVRNSFAFLKGTDRLDDMLAKSVALADDAGYLVPVCELHSDDGPLIERLAQWREASSFAFPTQFPVTVDGTRTWLRERLLDVEDRLLFLILDRHGRPVGHLGYASAINDERCMEIDNVVRGEADAPRGIMSRAMQAVLDWAEELFAPETIFLRVFSDNEHAVAFCRALGFRDDTLITMRRHQDGETVAYRELDGDDDAEPDKHFLRMVYEPVRAVDGSTMILTAGPSVSAREVSYTLDAARHGWNNDWSKYLKRFEEAFAEYIGVKHALATSSCTGALHVSLLALDVGPGDEVIVPDNTWVATAASVAYAGATPVFADVDRDSWCLDPDSFEAAITDRTKAVMPVHLYGHPARMDRIMEIANAHGLRVVEDAAPSIGATFDGKRTGSFGDFSAFSFQGAKLVVAGEGGMLVTDDDGLYERVYQIWDQGRTPGTFWINEVGWKYKMSNMQAAFGLGQLERVEELVEAKRRVFSWYEAGLAGVPGIRLMGEQAPARSFYWMSNAVVEEGAGISRDDLRDELKKRNVDSRPVFPAISQYPIWPKEQAPQPVSKWIGERGINLPSGVCLKRRQVEYVCSAIADIIHSGG